MHKSWTILQGVLFLCKIFNHIHISNHFIDNVSISRNFTFYTEILFFLDHWFKVDIVNSELHVGKFKCVVPESASIHLLYWWCYSACIAGCRYAYALGLGWSSLSQSIVAWAPMGVLSLYLYTLPCLWWPLCRGKGEDIMAFLDCQLDYTEEDID